MPKTFAIALHGGAGVHPHRDYGEVEEHLGTLVRDCAQRLAAGEAALDLVEYAVADLERSGLYVAGRGSAPNSDGDVECDAAIMDGASGRAGGVCALRDIAHPIQAARAVLENTPHVLLAGKGAREFALAQGCAAIDDPASHFCIPVGVDEAQMRTLDPGLSHGTVGAVALDCEGRLAAATSTGGLFAKLAGRVGDTPITGIGNWADRELAVSCTGIGEAFILAGGARDIAARMNYGAETLESAADNMLKSVAAQKGDGGLIALDRQGRIVMAFNSPGMKRAQAGSHIAPFVGIK